MEEDEERVVRVTVFINDGKKKKGESLLVPSDFQKFIKESARKLNLSQDSSLKFIVYTEEGGQIDSIEEILHDDELFISLGELFIPITINNIVELKLPEISETVHKNELEKKPQLTYEQLRKKQHKQFEPTLLQLNSIFPHLSFDELLTAVLLTEKNGKANLDEAIDLIIEGGHKKSLPIAKPGEIDLNEKKLDTPPPIKKAVEKKN